MTLCENKKSRFLIVAALALAALWMLPALLCRASFLQRVLAGRMGDVSQAYCQDKIFQFEITCLLLVFFAATLFFLASGITKWTRYRIPTRIIFFLLSLVVFFGICEFGTRAFQAWVRQMPFFESDQDYLDPLLGWKRPVYSSQNAPDRPRVMILGDSMTEAREIPLSNRYYAQLERRLSLNVWVVAASGYGTLQEVLALERDWSSFRPQLVLLQMHPNDVINNSWELERRSFFSNKSIKRPYLQDHQIRYLYPAEPQWLYVLRSHVSSHSRFISFLFKRMDILRVRLWQMGLAKGVEAEIEASQGRHEAFDRSLDITTSILERLKLKLGPTPFLVFLADNDEPYASGIKQGLKRLKIPFSEDIPGILEEKHQRGIPVYGRDGVHWNETAHTIVADNLEPLVKKSLNQIK